MKARRISVIVVVVGSRPNTTNGLKAVAVIGAAVEGTYYSVRLV